MVKSIIKMALEVLMEIVKDKEAPASDRIAAAKILIDYCVDCGRELWLQD